ncbi:MAG: hypothetical protein ACRED5_01530 [Propylenella sp.]
MEGFANLTQVLQNIVLAAAAVVGAYIAWKGILPARSQADAARNQAELARRAHVLDLFQSAVSRLADPKLEIRLGAIYVLRYIAEDYPDLGRPVLELLNAYIRERSTDYEDDMPPVDVREIITILKRRSP